MIEGLEVGRLKYGVASVALKRSAHAAIASLMATALAEGGDLIDPVAISATLIAAGFSERSVEALGLDAARTARVRRHRPILTSTGGAPHSPDTSPAIRDAVSDFAAAWNEAIASDDAASMEAGYEAWEALHRIPALCPADVGAKSAAFLQYRQEVKAWCPDTFADDDFVKLQALLTEAAVLLAR